MNNEFQNSEPGNSPEDNNQDDKSEFELNEKNKLHPAISPISAAFIGLLGGFFLYQLVGGIITLLIFGFDIEKAPVNSFRLMTMAGQVLFILLPALLFSKWIYQDVTSVIRFNRVKWKEIGLFTIGIIILTPMLENFVLIQNFFLEKLAASSSTVNSVKVFFDGLNDKVEATYSNLLSVSSIAEGLLVVMIVAVVPAICEEVMFRGFIQKSFELRLRPARAILFTGIFFGAYHFSPYGLIPLIGLGVYFGFAVYMSNSIFVSMALHFFNNFVAIMIFFYIGNEGMMTSSANKEFNLNTAISSFIGLLALFSVVIYLIVKYYKEKKITNKEGI